MDILNTLKSKVDQVEVMEFHGESTKVGYESSRLKSSTVEETSGMAVRVIKDGKLGFASSTDMSAGEKLIANALESAIYGDPIDLSFPAPQNGPEVVTYDQTIVDLPIPRMVEIGQEIVDMLTEIDADVLVDVTLERSVQQYTIKNQTGTEVSIKTSPMQMVIGINRIKGDDVLMIYDVIGTTIWDDDYLAPVLELGKKLKLAGANKTIKSGRMPVLFSPRGALVLGFPLTMGLDGKNVYTGISPMKGKIGQKLFDEKITIVDDGTLDGRFGSAPYDDEGMPHQRTVLVENGVLKGFLYDLKTAAQAGATSTGNGSRGRLSQPSPSPTNLLFQPGDTPLKEIIAGIDEGLLVEDVLGLGQGNVVSGAFSNPVSLAFKIEKGEIVGRVKDVSIAGNVYDLLQNVQAVSRETQWVYASFSLPSILIPEMNVIAKANQ
ncbi:MAG: TldD/PmbA family protein [Anaerolineae bacterium]|nr:TldD/PmbA family protein [Anaerolineae bacterium]